MVTPAPTTSRELDALVAQQVLGLLVEPRRNARTGEQDYVHATPSGRDRVRVAFYTSSMGAAIAVEVELARRGWKRLVPPIKERGEVTVVLQHADGRTVEATGPLNEALCRAALKAVGP